MLLIYIDRLGFFSHLYRCLSNYITIWQHSWASVIAFYVEVRLHCTIAVSAWCSTYQFIGCKCAIKVSCAPLGHLNAEYMGIHGYMKPYMNAFNIIYIHMQVENISMNLIATIEMFICIFILLNTCIFAYIGMFWLAFGRVLHP